MRFRKRLKENLSFFDFCKVDLTDWGSYPEIDIFLEKSLVEGNQVLEARYLIGDEEISNDLEEKKF
ncbi:MAG: hypothetical protein QW273_03965 [Candidatus Pacearchaeota archaeon]